MERFIKLFAIIFLLLALIYSDAALTRPTAGRVHANLRASTYFDSTRDNHLHTKFNLIVRYINGSN
uniref:Uncharacterized protein n=1 Tax=Ipomoea trifida TaxID=35884 RepID=A0A945_IPOTF|nr:hypothetical protein [Ipomoea trifida]